MDPNTLACPEHMDLLRQLAESKAWVNINQGADARLLTEDNIDALNRVKLKMIHFALGYDGAVRGCVAGIGTVRKIWCAG